MSIAFCWPVRLFYCTSGFVQPETSGVPFATLIVKNILFVKVNVNIDQVLKDNFKVLLQMPTRCMVYTV